MSDKKKLNEELKDVLGGIVIDKPKKDSATNPISGAGIGGKDPYNAGPQIIVGGNNEEEEK